MCGVNGIFAYHYASNPIEREEFFRTRDRMALRGPDGVGEWFSQNGHVGLGHRRLSIIDLSDGGAQPMTSRDGRLVITFNGEIYNYRDLRRGLEGKGYSFRSQSDTEVLLHLYADKGEAMVHDLRGMFAFAIWDENSGTLFLARDPHGIKPLYYADDGWTFRFASQVKAILAGGAVSRDPEPAGVVGFYLFGSVPEPFTSYSEIRALPAGTTLIVSSIGAGEPRRYHSVAEAYAGALQMSTEPAEPIKAHDTAAVRDILLDSVRHHLVSDVPVGAFLSSGIDSGALVGLMRDAGQNDIETVTLVFDEFQGKPEDEAPLASEVARLYETRHTTRVVTEAEFVAELPHILDAMDQPSIDGINTWFVSKAAHELGLKVAISGLGGDELFGGYPSFRDIPRWVAALSVPSQVPLLGRAIRALSQPLVKRFGLSEKASGMVEWGGTYAGAYFLRRGLFMPWELAGLVDTDLMALGLRRLAPMDLMAEALTPDPGTPFGRIASLESSLYMRNQLLRDTDWASMAHSLEVRVPLVDRTLLARMAPLAANMPRRNAKTLLASSPSRGLPMKVISRAKTGFTTPIARWLRNSNLFSGNPIPQASSRTPAWHWSRQWACRVGTA